MIWVFLLENADRSLAPDYVNTLAVWVIVHVVRVASASQCCDNVARLCAKNDELGWAAASDEQPVISFIQRHREVESIPIEPPFRNDTRPTIDRQGDVSTIGIVHEDFGARRFQLKRFWVPSPKVVVAAKALVRGRIDYSDSSGFIFAIS